MQHTDLVVLYITSSTSKKTRFVAEIVITDSSFRLFAGFLDEEHFRRKRNCGKKDFASFSVVFPADLLGIYGNYSIIFLLNALNGYTSLRLCKA